MPTICYAASVHFKLFSTTYEKDFSNLEAGSKYFCIRHIRSSRNRWWKIQDTNDDANFVGLERVILNQNCNMNAQR